MDLSRRIATTQIVDKDAVRAGDVRAAYPLFLEGSGGSIPTSALQLRFYRTDRETFIKFNRLWHSQLPKIGCSQGRAFYMAEYDGRVYAVAMWSNPVARLLPQKTWMELRRLAIADDAPNNTASRMLGWMARDIKTRFSEIVRLVSYQDCNAHAGTIYKAAGWTVPSGYMSRKRGWAPTTNWASRFRSGRTNQAVSPRLRWEKAVRP